MNNRQQITSRGIEQRSGLETLSSVINFTGEYVNFGNAFSYGVKLNTDTDYATETATPHIGALIGSPPSIKNQWYRYHSSGSLYTNTSAPTSTTDGWFKFSAKQTEGLPSYSGMYQKLSLVTGKEYSVDIQTGYTTNTGTIYFNTYTPANESYILTSTSSISFPSSTAGHLSILNSTFIAQNTNDIIVIYATTTEGTEQILLIQSISIQEKQEYLIPVYANDGYEVAHKVLSLAYKTSLI